MSRKKKGGRRHPGNRPPASEIAPPISAPWIGESLWLLAGGVLYWSFGFAIAWGSDLWWHLAAGRWMQAARSLPRADPFSFTRLGKPWLHHEWLSDLVLSSWTSLWGMRSLVYWKWGMIVATFLLLQWTLARLTRNPLASFLGSAGAAAVASPFLDIRPHLFSLLGAAVVLAAALVPRKIPWGLPILFLFWANLHGGFFLGLMLLFLVLLAREFDPEACESRARRAGVGALCVAAALANINGIEAFAYPLRYAFDVRSPFRRIGEWQPPFVAGGTHSPLYPWAIGAFVASILVLVVSGKWRGHRRLFLAGLAIGALTLAMSLRSRRFVPFFGIAAATMIAPAIAAFGKPPRRFRLSIALPAAFALVALFRLLRYPLAPRAFHTLTSEESFPFDSAAFLAANRISGNVFALYNWGGFLEMESEGRLKVFIDGRADTVFDESTYDAYLAVASRDPGWEDTVAGSGAAFFLWPREDREVWGGLVRSGLWRPLYEDGVSKLLVRSDFAVPSPLAPPPDTGYHRLSLAFAARVRGDLAETERQLEEALARMPEMNAPCHFLARVRALRGDRTGAVATEESCQRSFPQPLRRKEFEDFLRSAGS